MQSSLQTTYCTTLEIKVSVIVAVVAFNDTQGGWYMKESLYPINLLRFCYKINFLTTNRTFFWITERETDDMNKLVSIMWHDSNILQPVLVHWKKVSASSLKFCDLRNTKYWIASSDGLKKLSQLFIGFYATSGRVIDVSWSTNSSAA